MSGVFCSNDSRKGARAILDIDNVLESYTLLLNQFFAIVSGTLVKQMRVSCFYSKVCPIDVYCGNSDFLEEAHRDDAKRKLQETLNSSKS